MSVVCDNLRHLGIQLNGNPHCFGSATGNQALQQEKITAGAYILTTELHFKYPSYGALYHIIDSLNLLPRSPLSVRITQMTLSQEYTFI